MSLSAPARVLVRLAIACFVVATIGFVWEILAAQAPSSPYHMGVLPGPVGSFRDTAAMLGLLYVGFAWLVSVTASTQDLKWQTWTLVAGTAITLLALGYAATTGMKGVQINDPRQDAAWLFRVRALGALALGGGLFDMARRIWQGLKTKD